MQLIAHCRLIRVGDLKVSGKKGSGAKNRPSSVMLPRRINHHAEGTICPALLYTNWLQGFQQDKADLISREFWDCNLASRSLNRVDQARG